MFGDWDRGGVGVVAGLDGGRLGWHEVEGEEAVLVLEFGPSGRD